MIIIFGNKPFNSSKFNFLSTSDTALSIKSEYLLLLFDEKICNTFIIESFDLILLSSFASIFLWELPFILNLCIIILMIINKIEDRITKLYLRKVYF